MSNVAETICRFVPSAQENRRLTVGVLLQNNSTIPQRIVASGHRVVVIGDRFRILYSAYKQTRKADPPAPLMVEALFNAVPIRPGSLDVLILSRGLPMATLPQDTLIGLRALLKDGGLFVWPHPVSNGIGGKIGRALIPFRPGTFHAIPRDRLCTLAMESGFAEIGQVPVARKIIPWVITTGLAAKRPWVRAPKKTL